MHSTHISRERQLPLWAIGAPAIGVPLMVALLSLTAPKQETPDAGALMEQVQGQAFATPLSFPPTISDSEEGPDGIICR